MNEEPDEEAMMKRRLVLMGKLPTPAGLAGASGLANVSKLDRQPTEVRFDELADRSIEKSNSPSVAIEASSDASTEHDAVTCSSDDVQMSAQATAGTEIEPQLLSPKSSEHSDVFTDANKLATSGSKFVSLLREVSSDDESYGSVNPEAADDDEFQDTVQDLVDANEVKDDS